MVPLCVVYYYNQKMYKRHHWDSCRDIENISIDLQQKTYYICPLEIHLSCENIFQVVKGFPSNVTF